MLESFEHTGYWYLPADPTSRVAGILRYSPTEGVTLELAGLLLHAFAFLQAGMRVTILGDILHGGPITLLEARMTSAQITVQPSEAASSSFTADFLILGTHFGHTSEIQFRAISVRFDHLDLWADLPAITQNVANRSGNMTARYVQPKPILLAEADDLQVRLVSRINETWPLDATYESLLRQEMWIDFTFREPQLFRTCLEIMTAIQLLLAFGVGSEVHPMQIRAYLPNARKKNNARSQDPIQIFYSLGRNARVLKRINPDDMLFTLPDTGDQLSAIGTRFLQTNIGAQLRPAYALYFATLYNEQMTAEPRFITLMQALEVYHRRISTETLLPADKFQEKVSAILDHLRQRFNSDIRGWVKGRLKYGNELPLELRITRILAELGNLTDDFIDNASTFAKVAADNRNYYTHYSEELRSKALVGEDLDDLCTSVKYLLETCFLVQLGFARDDIRELIRRKRRGIPRGW